MIRVALAALLVCTLFAFVASGAGDPRPCLGACRVTLGKCYTQTRNAAKQAACLEAYSACSKSCHERAGTAER